jgi:hypothetical protein
MRWRVFMYVFWSIALGFVLLMGVELYVQWVLGDTECAGETWLGRAICGDSEWTVAAICLLVGTAIALTVPRLLRR